MTKMNFNGQWIDNLYVDPHRGLGPGVENTTVKVGQSTGETFLHSTKNKRTIAVDYQIYGSTRRELELTLADELYTDDVVPIIFSDKPNEVWYGKLDELPTMEKPGVSATGTFSLLVPDGLSHALTPTTATNENSDGTFADTIELTNNGTVPTPVNIETEFDHDNGFFAASLDDRYYQVGRPTEVDVVNYQQNETLIHDSYASDDELSSYTKNSALHRYNPTGTHQQGEFMTVVTDDDKRTVLQIKNTGTLVKGWQGPALTKTIPADSNGVLGVKNPALEVYLDFYATNNLQSGILEINLTDANDKFVAGVLFRKPAQGHKHIEITFYAGDKAVWTSKNDARWDNFRGRVSIYKFNNHFWFGLSKLERGKDNHTASFNYYDDTLKDLTATKYHIWASHWQDQKFMMIELFETKLVKQNVDKQANVANFFSPGDKLLINSEEYKTYINDVVDLDNVATGSKPLILPPQSTTTLALATSEFGHLRKVTATYRERWI